MSLWTCWTEAYDGIAQRTVEADSAEEAAKAAAASFGMETSSEWEWKVLPGVPLVVRVTSRTQYYSEPGRTLTQGNEAD